MICEVACDRSKEEKKKVMQTTDVTKHLQDAIDFSLLNRDFVADKDNNFELFAQLPSVDFIAEVEVVECSWL